MAYYSTFERLILSMDYPPMYDRPSVHTALGRIRLAYAHLPPLWLNGWLAKAVEPARTRSSLRFYAAHYAPDAQRPIVAYVSHRIAAATTTDRSLASHAVY